MAISNEERIARLESGYEHIGYEIGLGGNGARLLAAMMHGQSETNRRIDDCNGRIDRVFWAVLGVGGGLLAAAVAALIRSAI